MEHRIELVREIKGVKYYNSSIDSSPSRTAAALNSFKQKTIVIAGGYDKNIPLDSLGPLFCDKVKACVLMGDTMTKILSSLEDVGYNGVIFTADDMKEAVDKASSIATEGDVIILSPAAASFDKYKNFSERGKHFKNIVNEL